MTKLTPLLLALPLLLLLAGCDPTPPPVEPVETSTSAPTEPEESEAPEAPVVVADYLVEHMDEEENASELFHYAFWTDDSKSVRCDVTIGGQSDPYANCFVMAGAEGSATFTLPAGITADCAPEADPRLDGFEVHVVAIPADAGYPLPRAAVSGCADYRWYPTAEVATATRVLPDGGSLDLAPFVCSVSDAVATCTYGAMGASVSLGLTAIAVVN